MLANVGTCQTDGAGCTTNYTYDVVGNLRRVEQGSQYRYFAYDSLGRLLRAKQPEQTGAATSNVPAVTDAITGNTSWSLAYFYDNNGNLTSRVDARNATTSYSYDAVNRLRVTSYSDGTPQTSRRYDLATNAKGRLISTYETGTAGSVQYVESYDAVGRPTSLSKQFYNNAGGGWSGAYRTQRSYDKAGNVTSQTYPSGRSVAYSQDAAGRSQSFTGYLGDGVLRNYATDIKYDEGSRLQQEQFGTQTALYHKHKYNVRGQLYDVRLSSQGNNDEWNRGAIVNYYGGVMGWGESSPTNNGNVTAQQVWIPDATGNVQVARQQNYAYDELNRLTGMEEYLIAGGAGLHAAQWYYYDRWGNRQINYVATTSNVNRTQLTLDQTTNRVYSQADASQPDFTQRQIRYDLAGNQTHDQYTSTNAYRVYDGENRMVYSNVGTGAVQSTYTYDTDGKRVRTLINNSETWFIYGLDGELLAEYGQGQTPVLPTKEYGYRNGELLIVAEAPTSYELVVRHTGKCADVVYMWTHDGANLVQYDCWGGSNQRFSIEAVGGGYYKIIAQHSGRALSIENNASHGGRVVQWSYYGGLNQQWSVEATDSGYVRLIARHSGEVMEIAGGPGATQNGAELIQWTWWGGSSQQWKLRGVSNSSTVKWLINDHLGTPRMIADSTGSLQGITRRDYLPFGGELLAGGRSASQGYAPSNTRQGFTGYEHDTETGLEYAQARYYSSPQGRFTSVDPLQGSARLSAPQTWNRYAYGLNNPLRFVDPTGMATEGGTSEDQEREEQRKKKEQQEAEAQQQEADPCPDCDNDPVERVSTATRNQDYINEQAQGIAEILNSGYARERAVLDASRELIQNAAQAASIDDITSAFDPEVQVTFGTNTSVAIRIDPPSLAQPLGGAAGEIIKIQERITNIRIDTTAEANTFLMNTGTRLLREANEGRLTRGEIAPVLRNIGVEGVRFHQEIRQMTPPFRIP